MINDYFYPYLDDFDELTIIVPLSNYRDDNTYWLMEKDEKIALTIREKDTLSAEIKLVCSFSALVYLENNYFVVDSYGNQGEVKTGKIVRTDMFDRLYAYERNDLGVSYSQNNTIFKIWSPAAKHIELEITDKNNEIILSEMTYQSQGVWKATINGDLEGKRYRYFVKTNGKEQMLVDPYAIACSANAEYGYIVDQTKFMPMIHKTTFSGNPLEAIIYEVSVRDFTSDSSIAVNNPCKYKGFVEKGITTPKGHLAGIDYLKQLGITHVQLMPIFDYAGIDENNPQFGYNWGYNPRQLLIPSGAYAQDPNDPYSRINELRILIDELHRENINIVMDIVFNHLFDRTTSNLEKLVPGYAFRVDNQGIGTNFSGCFNDLATERRMVHKLIIDTVLWWAKTYKIDGFRFDLMGLIDVDTMNEVRQKLSEYDPHIIIYGEGWKMHPGTLSNQLASYDNDRVADSIGFFNDTFRDTIKGNVFEPMSKGFSMGNCTDINTIRELLLGSWRNHFKFANSSQSVNFVECHDNQTFFDQAMAISNDEKLVKKQQKLATSITILAQGIPFLHSGQEFYRTKHGVRDSYRCGDIVNHFDWTRLDENYDDIIYLHHLITIRKSNPGFNIKTVSVLNQGIEVMPTATKTVIYWLKSDRLYIIFKPEMEAETLVIPEGYLLVLASTNCFSTSNNSIYILQDIGTYVFQNKG
ncbi:MAG: type I pullulanase [Candidatus Izemoplasmatales bacterium]|nr:type I pullulanase [Candidatus Izemoplasmatales bacterium]